MNIGRYTSVVALQSVHLLDPELPRLKTVPTKVEVAVFNTLCTLETQLCLPLMPIPTYTMTSNTLPR